LEKLQNDKPSLAPLNVWRAYEALEQCNGSPRNELTAIVSSHPQNKRIRYNVDKLTTK
jgi:hypothetical protein